MERTVILHYHLFKNAGTSVDEILKRNFGDKWVTREFPTASENNTDLVANWIEEAADAIAFSSHTMVGPVPRIKGVRVISLILLRDPIDRIKSAYRFERSQHATTFGARLAKENDCESYVRARWARPGDRQCQNFHTHRLASVVPGPEPELERALRALGEFTIVGHVDSFDHAMDRLVNIGKIYFEGFFSEVTRNNESKGSEFTELTEDFTRELKMANLDDYYLCNIVK